MLAESGEPGSRTRAVVAHLLGLGNIAFTLFGLIGTLVVYLRSKDDPFVRDNARAALNMQITWTLVSLLALVAYAAYVYGYLARETLGERFHQGPVTDFASFWILLAGFGSVVAFMLAVAVMNVVGARAAHLGRVYRYPLAIPFLRA